MPTPLHDERLTTVLQVLLAHGVQSVLDLGCGRGEMLALLLAEPQFTRIVGMDVSPQALEAAQGLRAGQEERLDLVHGSYTQPVAGLDGFDAALLVETIEHLDPSRLSQVEHAVFDAYRPRLVVITTPNRDYNVLHGLAEGVMRHRGHRFEWTRAKFKSWAEGVAARNGYAVVFADLGAVHLHLGGSSQMATFTLREI
ncbi:3' terminal RNA ribose 2'-O-methyltransferase Hen1 [Geoalkalibacter ferrihydriticus]|uniref:Small RNA 2'-O-methyltransferase n=2 Tax=Geoalkalibacter ferrihydriticus TaxID=392333 RepID=A0A0C2DXG6_9BACT|nr:methyltransferase domain-containing protein [Geoalkalibacter ferrihydriticus]KIH78124.1 hypothetical protein GFER_06010 [Geoalkalibacter ferrihydriticus DSM 17813]SDM79954.1 3' terminal RNA ribose 2'-O-methyltransferase Hen1 [Geoalkalibacter ferrihydriticus]